MGVTLARRPRRTELSATHSATGIAFLLRERHDHLHRHEELAHATLALRTHSSSARTVPVDDETGVSI
jgi:hypothetical protein